MPPVLCHGATLHACKYKHGPTEGPSVAGASARPLRRRKPARHLHKKKDRSECLHWDLASSEALQYHQPNMFSINVSFGAAAHEGTCPPGANLLLQAAWLDGSARPHQHLAIHPRLDAPPLVCLDGRARLPQLVWRLTRVHPRPRNCRGRPVAAVANSPRVGRGLDVACHMRLMLVVANKGTLRAARAVTDAAAVLPLDQLVSGARAVDAHGCVRDDSAGPLVVAGGRRPAARAARRYEAVLWVQSLQVVAALFVALLLLYVLVDWRLVSTSGPRVDLLDRA